MTSSGDPRHEAALRLLVGLSFGRNARILLPHIQSGGDDKFLDPPFYYAVSMALELTLKAVILHLGDSTKSVRSKGHKLADLYDRAEALGWRPTNPLPLRRLVEVLGEQHTDQFWRYLSKEEVIAPDAAHAVAVLDEHVTNITRLYPGIVAEWAGGTVGEQDL